MVNINMHFLKCIISCHSRHVCYVFCIHACCFRYIQIDSRIHRRLPKPPTTVQFISKMFHPNGINKIIIKKEWKKKQNNNLSLIVFKYLPNKCIFVLHNYKFISCMSDFITNNSDFFFFQINWILLNLLFCGSNKLP